MLQEQSMGIPPAKEFGTKNRVWVQAQQIWLVLVAHIMNSARDPANPSTITYGDLAEKIGMSRRAGRTLGKALGIVGNYCKMNDLPTINSVVVRDDDKQPGDHVVLRDGFLVADEQAGVMRQNWFLLRVPTTGTLRQVWEESQREAKSA